MKNNDKILASNKTVQEALNKSKKEPSQPSHDSILQRQGGGGESQNSFFYPIAYHEMDINPVKEIDLIEQLHKNIERLSDMKLRLNFSLREIRYLMKI